MSITANYPRSEVIVELTDEQERVVWNFCRTMFPELLIPRCSSIVVVAVRPRAKETK